MNNIFEELRNADAEGRLDAAWCAMVKSVYDLNARLEKLEDLLSTPLRTGAVTEGSGAVAQLSESAEKEGFKVRLNRDHYPWKKGKELLVALKTDPYSFDVLNQEYGYVVNIDACDKLSTPESTPITPELLKQRGWKLDRREEDEGEGYCDVFRKKSFQILHSEGYYKIFDFGDARKGWINITTLADLIRFEGEGELEKQEEGDVAQGDSKQK